VIAKLTSKNQLTLPQKIVKQFPGMNYFSVEAEYGRIILEPINTKQLSQVHEKLEQLGVDEEDVLEAVAWSRKRS
jgi:bifunctional DNA-binding transcriptional regulator/antitoxin component of YhaV-PrlF toxin-antitoxin module